MGWQLDHCSEAWLAGSEPWLAGSEACLAGSEDCQAGSWSLGAGGRSDEWTKPILQDFVLYQGCCPVTAQLQPENSIKRGKGTADHMIPLGDWLSPVGALP